MNLDDDRPKILAGLMALLALLGSLSLLVSYVDYRTQRSAASEDVDRNALLVQEVQHSTYRLCQMVADIRAEIDLQPANCEPPLCLVIDGEIAGLRPPECQILKETDAAS